MADWSAYFSTQNKQEKTPFKATPVKETPVIETKQYSEKRQTLLDKIKDFQTKTYSKQPLTDFQSDPNNPLYSINSFRDIPLRPELRRGLVNLKFVSPSKVQGLALPIILRDPPSNLIAQSQSGTGKTATFAIGMLNRINLNIRCVQSLCVTPTYELAVQVAQAIELIGQHMKGLSVYLAIRDSYVDRNSEIRDHVVVGTPGKLLNLLEEQQLLNMTDLKVFVLDEADIIIEQGEETRAIDIYKFLPRSCQILLFSATFTDSVIELGKQMAEITEIIRVAKPELTLENIEQYYIYCVGDEEKKSAIDCIYQNMGVEKAIIFCNTVAQSNILFDLFVGMGYKVVVVNSSYNVKKRAEELNRFKRDAHVLISTNVTARGLDISGVAIVLNYEVPVKMDGSADYETYLHRIGRSGRFGEMGFAFTFVSSRNELSLIKGIEGYFERPIKELKSGDSKAIGGLVNNDSL